MLFSGIQKLTLLDFPDHTACILFTPGCNFRCGFCHNPEFVLPKKLAEIARSFIPEEAVLNFLTERRKFLDGVVITGGEPTIWHDLPLFLAKVQKLGFSVKLDTNGNHPVMLEHILKEGLVDYVAMDVKTSLEAYPTLVGTNVKEENISKNIALLKANSIPYEFRTTLIKEHHTSPILEEMKELLTGAERLFLQTFRPKETLDPVFEQYHPFSSQEMQGIADFFRTVIPRVNIRG